MTTPLHAALGRADDELSIGLLREACDLHIAESEQLDFKAELPLPLGAATNDEVRSRTLELARDLAAMANSRGGVLVFGIRDEADRAAELVGVPDLSDGVMERRIHQVGYNMVYPPVQVRCHALVEGGLHALVVEIVESEEAPHLVQPRRDGGNGWLMAPYRSGPDTLNMREKQIEAAYRRRLDRRWEQVRELRELHTQLVDRHIDTGDRRTGTIALVAQPRHPRRGTLSERDPARYIQGVVRGALVFASQILGELRVNDQFPIDLLDEVSSPRRGLRRYVFSASRQIRNSDDGFFDRCAYVALEVHDDGSIGLVWRRGPGYAFSRRTSGDVPVPSVGQDDMDIVSVLALALIVVINAEFKLATDWNLRAAIVPSEPLWLIPRQGWADDVGQVPVAPPAEVELRTAGSPDVRAADFLDFSSDLANMVEQTSSVLERFWELPTGSRPDHPRRLLARELFDGEPDHPTRGTKMA